MSEANIVVIVRLWSIKLNKGTLIERLGRKALESNSQYD
jgi:hypothetical protein